MWSLWQKFKNYVNNSWHYAIVPTTIGLVLYFACTIVFGSGNNLTYYLKARAEIKANERQIAAYRAKIQQLGQQRRYITTNPDSLEKLAREKYHLCENDEDIYLLK